MSKIKPMALVESMSGKVCTHSDVYFRTNKKTGKVCSGKLCNPSTKPASVDQISVRQKFTATMAKVKAICSAKSTDTNTANYEKQVAYRKAYDAQHEIGVFTAFVFKKEYAAEEED